MFYWFRNNALVATTTGSCLNIPVVSCSDTGVYTVQIVGTSGNFTTAPCKIKVKPCPHVGDLNDDGVISLGELLRVIQFFNSNGIQCDPESEDGFSPGQGDTDCVPHSSDYNPQDWRIALNELLRFIQFFNAGGCYPCPEEETEDGFCIGPPPGR